MGCFGQTHDHPKLERDAAARRQKTNSAQPLCIAEAMANNSRNNEAFNIREYGLSIIVTIFLVLICALAFVHHEQKPLNTITNPKPTSGTSPQ